MKQQEAHRVQKLSQDIAIMRFPLRMMTLAVGRTVTLIRLPAGDLLIHSTAPFSPADVDTIHGFGRPIALMEANLLHDTFRSAGRRAFPDLPYYVPDGFASRQEEGPVAPISRACVEWLPHLQGLRLDGMPRLQEHVFFHPASRTLIVADLLFNFGRDSAPWTRLFFRYAAGVGAFPGTSRLFRILVRDRTAFARSIRTIMEWDFDRIVVGHGEVIESGGKARLREALPSWAIL